MTLHVCPANIPGPPEVYPCGASNPGEPRGYLEWFHWAKKKSLGHRQKQCKSCRLWHIWEEK